MKFLTVKEVIKIHDKSIDRFGGSRGIRDVGLLESAIHQARMNIFGVYLHADVYEVAAAYCFYIIKNHAFVDGNKRTGIVTAIIFLEKNGLMVNDNFEVLYNFAIGVASSRYTKEEIVLFFKKIAKAIKA